jgi:chorismate mutase/prephenate dehydratase
VPTPSEPTLEVLRGSIDTIDDRVLDLLAERTEVVAAIAERKRAAGTPSLDPEREAAVLARLVARGAGRFPAHGIAAVYRDVMSASVALQGPVTVACLGPAGSWTEAAARALFGYAARYLEETTIEAVVDAVRRGAAELGVVPIENSTEGLGRCVGPPEFGDVDRRRTARRRVRDPA